MNDHDRDYQDGVRDGKIRSLEAAVQGLTVDLNKMKVAIYMLYGAIALVQFLPELKAFVNAG